MTLTALPKTANPATIVPEGDSWGAIFDTIQAINDDQLEGDLAIDCSELKAIDSSDLGALVGLRLKMKARDLRLSLTNVNSDIKEVLDVARLSRIFDIHEQPATKSRASHGFGNWLRHLMA